MERPKQQALAFLLGALLVGGVLGFSADRVLTHKEQNKPNWRSMMYSDIGLSDTQRAAFDSLLDARDCRVRAVYNGVKPAKDSIDLSIKPTVDSIKAATRAQMHLLLSPEQRTRLDARRKADSLKKANDAKNRSADKPQQTPCQS